MADSRVRIERAAQRLRIVTLLAVGLVALTIAGSLAILGGLVGPGGLLRVEIDMAGLQPTGAGVVLAVAGLLLIAALLQLAAMLRAVEAGAPFGAARGLRGFARYLFLAIAAAALLPPLIHLFVAREARFSLSGGEALMLLVTGLLFFVARLLDEAQSLADEHAQIV